MILTVRPTNQLKGKIALPASKSYSIRAFIVAACGGTSQVLGVSDCEDAIAAMGVAQALGARVHNMKNSSYRIQRSSMAKSASCISVNESGTALRFVLPLAALQQKKIMVRGKGTLRGRPNKHLIQALRQRGVKIAGMGSKHSIPITIQPSNIKPGRMMIDGTMSSQFISGLMLMAPQLASSSTISIKGRRIVSTDYIQMTLDVMRKAGIKVQKKDNRIYAIKGNQTYKGLKNFRVPSDYGLAAFHMVAAALTSSTITLTGHLDDAWIQADGHIIPLLKKMGVSFVKTKRSITMRLTTKIRGGTFSLKTAPDLLPILAVLALFANKATRFTDIAHVRVKESDRITDLRKELEKVGAKIKEKQNEMVVYPLEKEKTNCLLNPHHDHRLAMAFAVLGLKVGVRVKDMQCCAKSYPGFVRDFKRLGAKVK